MGKEIERVFEKPSVYKRICWVGAYKGEHCLGRYVCRALRQMGFTVDVIDYRQNFKRLDKLLKNINADLVIVSRGEGISPELINNLQCPTILWYGEYIFGNDEHSRNRLQILQYNAGVFDYVVWGAEENPESIQLLRNIGCNRVGYTYPCRFDSKIYKKLGLPKIYDVSFIGTVTQRRKYFIQTLNKRFKIKVKKVWKLEEQVRFYNQSKIVLHINSYPFINIAGVNLRAFDVMGTGTMMLHEDVVFPKVFNKQFEDKKHLVFWRFNNIDDLSNKIEYYLRNDTERQKIAEAGYEFVNKNFSVEHSVSNLLRQVDFSLRARRLTNNGHSVAFDKQGQQTYSYNEFYKSVEPFVSSDYVQSFYEQGKTYFQLKRWEKACKMLEKSTEINSNFIQAIYLLALSYIKLQRNSEAVRELRRILKIVPFHADANLTLGELYLKLGDTEPGNYYKQKGLKLK